MSTDHGDVPANEWWWRETAPIRPTARSMREYKDEREEMRHKLGLCLSGGGFRAALFHLGALRRLNELGILSRVDRISAVSGGSILAAHLAVQLRGGWPVAGSSIDNWNERIRDSFWKIASQDLRSYAFKQGPSRAAHRLEEIYGDVLTEHMLLSELPESPIITFGATELVHGRYWISSRALIGSSSTVVLDRDNRINWLKAEWSVARAVAASSCFPPFFLPINVWKDVQDREKARFKHKELRLTDGGLYDNLGYMGLWNRCDTVLVSDGGGVSSPNVGSSWAGPGRGLSTAWRLLRYQSVQEYAGRTTQKAFLLSNLINGQQRGSYWSIKTKTTSYDKPDSYGYPHEQIVDGYLRRIRTDLNRFTPEEQGILENHGYWLAEAAINRYVRGSVDFGIPDMEPRVPNPDLVDPQVVTAALSNSHKRKLLMFEV